MPRKVTRSVMNVTLSAMPLADLADYNTIAVTGGNGFIGRHLVQSLCQLGKKVIIADLADAPAAGSIDRRTVDLRSSEGAHIGLDGADLVFHLAGNPSGTRSIHQPFFDFESNALTTQQVVGACRDIGVQRLVFLSSATVYGRPATLPIAEDANTTPITPYAASKLAAEHIVMAAHESYGLSTVIGRAFVVYGPGEGRNGEAEASIFARALLANSEINIIGDPDAKTRDFIHVNDLVGGLVGIADRAPDGSIVNLGTGRETSLRELATTVAEVAGRPLTTNRATAVLNDEYRMVADISKLRSLGCDPCIDLRTGVAALVNHLRSRPSAT
jgi:UDP-glucose 4-epimerase